MNSNLLRKRLSEIIDSKTLTYAEIERGASVPRNTFRNFMSGKVKEPRLEIILATAKFLDLDVNELFSSTNYEEKKEESSSTFKKEDMVNKELITDCVKSIMAYMDKKNIHLTFEESVTILRKVYDYSIKFSDGKLDLSFLEWCLDQTSH